MFRFEKSIVIRKTPQQVFDFVADPSKATLWREDVIETKFKSLPLQTGDQLEEVVDFDGPKTCVVEVIEIVPGRRLVFKALRGTTYLPLREFTFEEEGAHTKFSVKISAHSDGFSRLIEPISSGMYSVRWDVYLFNLKKVLERVTENV